jgi:hypothetical protein
MTKKHEAYIDYREHLLYKLRDRKQALFYLREASKDTLDVFILALEDVLAAQRKVELEGTIEEQVVCLTPQFTKYMESVLREPKDKE